MAKKVGIIVDNFTKEVWETTALKKALMEKGMQAELVNVKKHSLDLTEKSFEFEVGLGRVAKANSYEIHSIRYFEFLGVEMINSAWSTEIGANKFESLLFLKKAGLPVPRTAMVYSFEPAVKAVAKIGTPIVLKPVVGTQGRDIYLLRDIEKQFSLLDEMEKPYVIQEYIKTSGRDMRVFICNGDVVGCIWRKAPNREWRTNVSLGATTEKAKPGKEIEDIAFKAAKALKMEVAGVDIAFDKDENPYIIEVNTMPDFRGIYSETGVNAADNIAELVKSKMKD